MRAIVMNHGEKPEVKDMEVTRDTLEEIVGGSLEYLSMSASLRAGMLIIANKHLREKPGLGIPNRAATFFFSGVTNTYLSRMDPRIICGNAAIVAVDPEGNFTDLTKHQLTLLSIVSSHYLKWNPLEEAKNENIEN